MNTALQKVTIEQLDKLCGRLESVRSLLQSKSYTEDQISEELFNISQSVQFISIEFQVEKFIQNCGGK